MTGRLYEHNLSQLIAIQNFSDMQESHFPILPAGNFFEMHQTRHVGSYNDSAPLFANDCPQLVCSDG